MATHRNCQLGALMLLVAACSKPADPGTNGMSPTTVTVDTVPSLVLPSIGANDSVNFGSTKFVARLANGELAILDESSQTIRVFGADGKSLREIGRRGEGPGEFQFPMWLGECRPDTLFVIDPATARISLFDSQGQFVRQHPFKSRGSMMACDVTGQVLRLDIIGSTEMPSEQSPLYQGTVTLVGFDAPDRVLDTIPLYRNRPMGQQGWIASANGTVYVGRGDSGFVESWRPGDSARTRHPLGTAGRAPTAAQYQAEIERWLRMLSRPEDRVRPREILEKIPAPAAMPAFRALVADPTGAVWAVTSPTGDAVTVLEGIDSLGRPFQPLRLPGDLDVHAVGRNHIVAIAEDADGSQRILVFKLTRKN
ncbi:MAG: hypothetical protein IPP98_10935 [Gemmatimonadetes bacterium]|nr:hypothetical protein [Gemmatimonadota bacterium]